MSTFWVKVKGQRYLRSHLTILQVIFEVKGNMDQGQRSYVSRPNVGLEGQR